MRSSRVAARGTARSASPATRGCSGGSDVSGSSANVPGVVASGARGEVWRAVALQAHYLGGCGGGPPRAPRPPGAHPGRGGGARGRGVAVVASLGRSASGGPVGGEHLRSGGHGTPSAAHSRGARRGDASCPPPAETRGADEAFEAFVDLDYDEKLRRHQASLTLAQRMGLVVGPSAPLTAEQWEAVKRASDDREDSDAPCCICLDDFRDRQQVILSCSHVFHQECLRSFEQFSGIRRCPLCRRSSCDATPHWAGFMVWRKKCASRIQRAWRGFKSRREVFDKLKQPQVRAGAPALHRRFCGRALHVAGDRLYKACEEREDALDRFLEDLDSSVARCSEQLRDGLLGFEQLHGRAGLADLADPSGASPAVGTVGATSPTVAEKAGGANANGSGGPVDAETWAKARRAVLSRGDEVDCPICFQDCQLRGRGSARVELLSCSHVFHRCCLMSFESFHVFEVHLCPVCRQSYERRPWQQSQVVQTAVAAVSKPVAEPTAHPQRVQSEAVAEVPRPPRASAVTGNDRQRQVSGRARVAAGYQPALLHSRSPRAH
eukprot:TRINITY_DN61407_c0_g1_i1.p1 TRINITY_DN61407_c0_g1~~TRINITY_DN61407_c0_g1_i1.p1  ORF type:complete len:550 (-),score=65.80 TRINITY_DN61407_c0_g1_i1:70-1719(-)